jgi:hypothetical protein
MFPVNVAGSHWTLLVFYPNSLMLCYYDSYHNIDISAINSLAGFISTSYEMHGHSADLENWLVLAPNKIPKQHDLCSCGVYTCMTAFYSINPWEQVHSTHDVNNIRYWIVHCLLTARDPKRVKTNNGNVIAKISCGKFIKKRILIGLPEDSDFSNVFLNIAKLVAKRRTMTQNKDNSKTLHFAGIT